MGEGRGREHAECEAVTGGLRSKRGGEGGIGSMGVRREVTGKRTRGEEGGKSMH